MASFTMLFILRLFRCLDLFHSQAKSPQYFVAFPFFHNLIGEIYRVLLFFWLLLFNILRYNYIFQKLLKTFRLDFLVFKLDFEETKLGFSNCKFPSILELTFQLLKRSRNPSKSKFWKFFNFEKSWFYEQICCMLLHQWILVTPSLPFSHLGFQNSLSIL